MDLLFAIHLLAAVLASWRITALFTEGERITESFRQRFPSYLWTCGRCVSVWAGICVTLATIAFPWACWPFAFSWVWMSRKAQQRGNSRQIIIEANAQGVVTVTRSDFQGNDLLHVLGRVMTSPGSKQGL